MAANPRKRRARDQLTPNNMYEEQNNVVKEVEEDPIIKRATINRKQSMSQENLRGIFGKKEDENKKPVDDSKKQEMVIESQEIRVANDPMSGLNKSFLKAISKIVNKQSNKDLRFIFKQYANFIKNIEEGKYSDSIIKEEK